MTVWYDEPETSEEFRDRHDRFGQPMHGPPTPFSRIVDRAHGIVKPHMRRAPRGIAMPFGLEHRDILRWRVSPDVRHALIAEWPTHFSVQATGYVETLFGVRIEVDYKADDGTLELVEQP